MSDDQQNTSGKQGLSPSPSNALSTINTSKTNTASDNTNGMKFLMVPGQSGQMGSFSSGKIHKFYRCARLFLHLNI